MNRVIFSVFALLLLSCKQGGETSETTIALAEQILLPVQLRIQL